MTARRGAALGGAAILLFAAVALAAAGPGLVPAATWLERGGKPVPGWLLGPFGQGLGMGGGTFYALLWLAFAGYLLMIFGSRALARPVVWLLTTLLVGLFIVAPPLLSQDVFSYIAYARMGGEHGLNPYAAIPLDIAGDPVFSLVGWPEAVSVYGPLFTLASYLVAPLSLPASLWLMKLVTGLAVLAIARLCENMALRRGLGGNSAVVLVALNPLTLVHVVGGAHNDALMMLAVTAGCALLISTRSLGAGAALAAGIAVKVAAGFVAPFALLGAWKMRRAGRFLLGVLGVGAILAVAGLAVFGSSLLDSLALVGDNQGATSRYSLPATASRIAGLDLDATRTFFLAGWAAAVLVFVIATLRGADWLRMAAWAGLVTLIATGWLLPWYLIWVLPLVAVARDRVLLFATLALSAFQLISRVPF